MVSFSRHFISISRRTLLIAFIIVFLVSFTYFQKFKESKIAKKVLPNVNDGPITPLEDNKTFIISAYYDGRESKRVRVIAILHDEDVKDLYCWFYCKNFDYFIPVKARIDVHSLRFNFHYGPADVICTEPLKCTSRYISVHWSNTNDRKSIPIFEIKNRVPLSFLVNFTVCISTMFGNSEQVLPVIQAIEMYRLLGAQKVVIYKNNCSKTMGKVFDYYLTEGLVEIIPWPIDKYLRTSDVWHQDMNLANQIGYYGQLVTLNDCMYRNMYKSRYVTFNDLDEIILPRMHKDWNEMMEALEKQYPNKAVFLIENHYYPINVTDSTFQGAFPKNVPGTNILQHIHYEPEQPNVWNNHKMIVNPREVIQTSVHHVLKAYKGNVDVPNDVAGLHHTRLPKQPNLPVTSLIRDTTIWKYNVSLINNVNKVLKQCNFI
ncbi:beta-1,4-galactosyltransferase galt-1-like [Aquarana catesbeiana]|uniref:beta-1,4-galactosyltransferase galt-1-like n=1 Tax=Aquarana catesbeiana TaxID=8400 RepID=UPI003CC99617